MWKYYFICVILTIRKIPVTAYKAAVLEYHPLTETPISPQKIILENLENYKKYADEAKEQSADIIVFPEYGLTTVEASADPGKFHTHSDHVIKVLKAVAIERRLYVVVNFLEAENGTNVTNYYNTDFVFDRSGSIIQKYRKINLYEEGKLTPGAPEQKPIFTTDFGVTFAIFTCFDILFRNPSRTVLQNDTVTDVVFPSAWISKQPFLMSTSVQHGYAISNGVNLLASNYNNPKNGRGGSGIYLANGTIAEIHITDVNSSKLLFQEVLKQNKRVEKKICTESPMKISEEFPEPTINNYIAEKFPTEKFKFENVILNQNISIRKRICDKKFCCTFDILMDVNQTSTNEVFKVIAFDGNISNKSESKTHIRLCSLVFCENAEDDNTCGTKGNTSTKFGKITVKGNFKKDNTTFYTPVTLGRNFLPLRDITYCDSNNDTDSSFVQLSTTKAQGVLVFGLFGNTGLSKKEASFKADKPPMKQTVSLKNKPVNSSDPKSVNISDQSDKSSTKVMAANVFIVLLVVIATLYF